MNPIFIIARLVIPISILKYPLLGGGLAILLDNLDWPNKHFLGIDPIFEYQLIDKLLDTYYLSLLFIVALRLKSKLIRNVLAVLFLYRLFGVVLFEMTQERFFLFAFPNIFENLFFLYFIIKFICRYEPQLRWFHVLGLFLLVTFPKMMQEYSIHIIQEPLVINMFNFSYVYKENVHQIIFIVVVSLLLGLYLRKNHSLAPR